MSVSVRNPCFFPLRMRRFNSERFVCATIGLPRSIGVSLSESCESKLSYLTLGCKMILSRYHLTMVEKRPVSERAMVELIEQLGRCAYGGTFTAGLNPAQWTALRYFGRANRFSRTVSAFALYHGTTRGTASQTVKALVGKGYLRRRPIETDHRTFRLELTAKARRFLAQDPSHDLVSAYGALSPEQRTTVVESLQTILARLVENRGRPLFGMCPSCAHLRGESGCLDGAAPYECGLFGETITEEDSAEICVNYQPAALP